MFCNGLLMRLGSPLTTSAATSLVSSKVTIKTLSTNLPLPMICLQLVQGALEHWQARQVWTSEYLSETVGSAEVTVDVTPDGRGDAVTTFLNGHPLAFLPHQHQNSNLTDEFTTLLHDVDAELPWASEVFGAAPDAVNLWVGDDRSVTSFHKDHYENLYAVIAGSKIFTLLPPSDVYRMHLGLYPAAVYALVDGKLQLKLKEPQELVMWCPIEPYPSDLAAAREKYPLFFDPELPGPLRVVIGPGDLLYLPSMWYHHVAQRADNEGKVIAVNYWYDMRFDVKYAYFKLVESLAVQLGLVPRHPSPPQHASDEHADSTAKTVDSNLGNVH